MVTTKLRLQTMRNKKKAEINIKGQKFRNVANPLLTASIMVYVGINLAQAENSSPGTVSPPAFTTLTYDEDYSYLKDPAVRTNLFDPLKYIPLDKQGDIYLTIGGQVRDRYEYFNNYTFGKGAQDPNGYNLIRTMLDGDL
ncbi:MAG TPA: hypothetical protein VGF01_06980, partial [Terracidiphilus sp.]